jgi:hypothetical protein
MSGLVTMEQSLPILLAKNFTLPYHPEPLSGGVWVVEKHPARGFKLLLPRGLMDAPCADFRPSQTHLMAVMKVRG